jgi:arylsulfatase A-like enzyme
MPTGRGFDYFYGFIAGETSQWEPTLWENTTPIAPPLVGDYEDYHLTEDMAERAITWMRRHVGIDTSSPVADDYFEKAPFPFQGKLKRLSFKNLQDERLQSVARRTMIDPTRNAGWIEAISGHRDTACLPED